ncbi:MAG: DUF4199 family protein [Chryseotalea sp.]|jgi:hypothetical protein|nr:hypothetical protein [Flammeovirgaceae bacterium]MCZ8022497.1 hypothetical protein [Cytophagales bacterium]
MSILTNPNRIPENYGLRIAAGLILFFLVMFAFGLAHVVELRLLNLLILTAGVYYGLKKFRATHEASIHYFRALATGVSIAAIGSAVFAFFLFLFLKFDTGLMEWIKENEPMGRFLNPYMAAFIVALEGVFSGLLVTFVLINYIPTEVDNVTS